MSVTGRPGQGPMRTGAAIADVSAGLYAALGILTALLEREASGQGQWVQSSLLMSGIALLDFQAARYLMEGEVPPQVGNDHPTSMPTSAYTTADGYINVAASGEGMWKRLCPAIGRPDLLERAEFKGAANRAKNRKALNAELNAALSAKKSEEWISLLNAAGVPCGPIYSMDQVFADAQVQHLRRGGDGEASRAGRDPGGEPGGRAVAHARDHGQRHARDRPAYRRSAGRGRLQRRGHRGAAQATKLFAVD